MRKFETGATRDEEIGKYDFEGFLAPTVLVRFAEYMHKHRIQADGNIRAIEFVKEAGKQLLNELQYGESSHDELHTKLIDGYMTKIYKADFETKIELNHFTESRGTVVSNLENVQTPVIEGLSKFSKNILKNSSVASLRVPSRKKPEVGLDVDIDQL